MTFSGEGSQVHPKVLQASDLLLPLQRLHLVSHSLILSILALSSEPLAMWWNQFSTWSDGLQKVNHQQIGELFPITGFAEYKSAKTATETCAYSNMISLTKRIQGKSSWFNSAALKLFCRVNIGTSWTPVADIWSAVPVAFLKQNKTELFDLGSRLSFFNRTKQQYLIWCPHRPLFFDQNTTDTGKSKAK